MDELKILVGLIKDLPGTAMFIVGGYYFYKIVVIGSIFGVVRLAIIKIHAAIVTKKTVPVEKVQVDRTSVVKGLVISGEFDRLMSQLHRIVGKRTNIDTTYIHDSSLQWLREAIDEKELNELKKAELKELGTIPKRA